MSIPEFRTCSDGNRRIEIESISELVDIAFQKGNANCEANTMRIDNYYIDRTKDSHGGHSAAGMKKWFNRTPEELKQQLEDPDSDLVWRVEELKQEIETEIDIPAGKRRVVRRRLEFGDEFDETAYVQRDPDGWSEVRTEAQQKKVVSIAVNSSVLGHRKPEAVYYRGAAAAALADLLNDLGYAVEITSFRCVEHLERRSSAGVLHIAKFPVKHADAPLDVSLVSFVLSEIGFYRGVVMPATARMITKTIGSGNGSTRLLPDEDKDNFDIVFDSDLTSKAAAVSKVKEYVKRYDTDKE